MLCTGGITMSIKDIHDNDNNHDVSETLLGHEKPPGSI